MDKEQLRQHLLPQQVKDTLPKLYSQEKVEDPIVQVKYFVPWGSWTWYVLEGEEDEDDFRFFGLVDGHDKELGYFVLSDFESIRGPGGLTIERDLHFTPTPVSKFK